MASIMALVPCLMLPNNHDINMRAMKENYEYLKPDVFAVYDQCFEKDDFVDEFTYIGHANTRMGWVEPRNALLRYFYNSNCDYAFWIDANSTISKPTLNDILTINNAIKEDKLNFCDTIFATLGMWVSQDRIKYKSAEDYFEKVHLIPAKNDRSYNWMHGMFHRNYKKYCNQEFYIDERCDTRKGTPDDVYFARMVRRYTNSYVAPTVVINKPNSKASCTWANEKGTYDYPPVLFDIVDRYIDENAGKYNYHKVSKKLVIPEVSLNRIDEYKDLIKPYKPRGKKKTTEKEFPKISLF